MMNTTRTLLSGSDLEMPSGFEVESATFHAPVGGGQPVTAVERRGIREKVELLRSRGVRTAHDIQNRIVDRSRIAQSSIRHSMQTHPVKWVAIAAGTGFGLGLLGRFVQWRNKRHSAMPELIVIDAHC